MLNEKEYVLFKGIKGIRCGECEQFIWSRSRHDFHYCKCGTCFVDGGRDYLRAGWEPDKKHPTNAEYDILLHIPTNYETLLPATEGEE